MGKKSQETIAHLRERNSALYTEVEVLHAKLTSAEQSRESGSRELEVLRDELQHVRARLERMESVNDRLTILLSNEQALRMKALPRRVGFFGRLFGARVDVASA